MKKLVLSIVLAGFGTFAMAQQKQMPSKWDPAERKAMMEQKRAQHMEEMQKELNLTSAQVTKINAMQDKYRAQHDQQQAMNREAMKQKMEVNKKNREQMDAEMKQILTPEQYQKWQAKKQEKMQQRKAEMMDRKANGFKKAQLQKVQK